MENFLRFLSEKAKKARNGSLTAELNKYEIEIMKILKIEYITDLSLSSCVEVHKKWKNDVKNDDVNNWLSKQAGLD